MRRGGIIGTDRLVGEGGVNVGNTMFTSYTSGCYGRQTTSLLVLILQHRHGAVAMVTSSRGREGRREGEVK